MINIFKRLDIFTQPIQFNSIEQTSTKKTVTGALLSVVVVFVSLSYFVYQSYLSLFWSQAFVRNDLISIPLNEELVSFQFMQYMALPNQQLFDPNKTYISYMALFYFQTITGLDIVALDVIQCKNSYLKGYLCVDFTNLKNRRLVYDLSNSMISSIILYSYRCTDTDEIKTFISDNCAKPEEIDSYISQQNYIMSYKIQQQQFNTTSKQMSVNYKNQFAAINKSQVMASEFKIQLQETEVIQGSFIQQSQSFSSPVSFNVNQFTMDYLAYSQIYNSKYISVARFSLDEQVHLTEIKYPSFPEVLAICNSTFALLMCLGYIARRLSFTLLKNQMLLMYMQNIFQGQYLNILQQNKILELNSINQQQDESDYQFDEQFNQINIPNLNVKQNGRVMNSKNKADFQLETLGEIKTESISLERKIKQNDSEILHFNSSINQNQIERSQTENQPFSTKSNLRIFLLTNTSVQNKIRIPMTSNKYIKKSKGSSKQIEKIQSPIQSQQLEIVSKKNQFENLSEKQSAYSNLKFKEKMENLLFKFKLTNKRRYQQSIGLNPKTKQLVEQQMQKSLDFIHLQKEILFLKKAIMILLSKDQFAMITLIGCSEKSIDYIYDSQNTKKIYQDEKKLNHFEELLRLSFNDDFKNEQITQFLTKCKNQSNLSEIDQRIISSIV